MSNIESLTPNFKLKIPNFNVATWHDEIKYNFTTIDALVSNFVSSVGFKGEWANVTYYTVSDTVFISDKESEHYGDLYQVLVPHTTDTSDFDTYLSQHSDYYTLFSIKAAYDAAELAQDWASKTDGIVRYLSQDLDYSSKAYAIGGTGTQTNNSKYYCQQAQAAANDPNVVAVGTDLLDAQSHIKNVSNNMENLQTVVNNLTILTGIYNNLSNINNVSDHTDAIEACATDLPNINQKANKNNAELTGTPTAPTASTSTDSQQIATTGYVKQLWQEVETVPAQFDPNVFYYILES